MARIVIVTGAAGALGSAVANCLAGIGYSVIGIDRAGAISRSAGSFSRFVSTDLSSASEVQSMAKSLAMDFPRVDALINVAGGFAFETIGEGHIDTWQQMFDINVRTTVNVIQAILPHLTRPGGSIVNVLATASSKAERGMGAYSAAKAGVARLTESLAAEFKDQGLRVNAVLPSIIDTPVNRDSMPKADPARWVQPRSLAKVIAFLISPDADAITGALVPVTGRA